MALNDDDDEFTADLIDIVDDADAPPGRVEIGNTEILDTGVFVDDEDDWKDGLADGMSGGSPRLDTSNYLQGYNEGVKRAATGGAGTNLGYQYEVTDEANADVLGVDGISGRQTEIGMDGISGEQTEIGYLEEGYEGQSGHMTEIGYLEEGYEGRSGHQTEIGQDGQSHGLDVDPDFVGTKIGADGILRAVEIDEQIGPNTLTPWDAFMSEPIMIGQDGISGRQTEIGYLDQGYEGRSGHQTEIGRTEEPPDPAPASWWRRLLGLKKKAKAKHSVGHSGGHGGGHGHHGGGRRGGGWGGPFPFFYDYGLPGIEIDDLDSDEGAVLAVIKTARDNRMPPPRMVAVDVDAPSSTDPKDEWALTDTVLGISFRRNKNEFPLTTQLMQRFGAGGAGRVVRVDTEESYAAFRAEQSPALAELRDKIADLEERFAMHEADPEAHDVAFFEGDIDNVDMMGAAAAEEAASKRVDLWLPERFRKQVQAWREGDFVCASINLPGIDGELRICTSMEPIRKCVDEMTRHATEAGVPASTVIGVVPAMGCVLGAGTVVKEMAAAAPSILARPEAKHAAPFIVRIEPKASPALCALAALAYECREGNSQACEEWHKLATVAPAPVRQAMGEALALAKDLVA